MLENDSAKNPLKVDALPTLSPIESKSESESIIIGERSVSNELTEPIPESELKKKEKIDRDDDNYKGSDDIRKDRNNDDNDKSNNIDIDDEYKNTSSTNTVKITEIDHKITTTGFAFTTVIPLLMALLEPPEMTRVRK